MSKIDWLSYLHWKVPFPRTFSAFIHPDESISIHPPEVKKVPCKVICISGQRVPCVPVKASPLFGLPVKTVKALPEGVAFIVDEKELKIGRASCRERV